MGRSFLSTMNQIARASARAARAAERQRKALEREAEREARRTEMEFRKAEREAVRAAKDAEKMARQAYLEARKNETADSNADIQEALEDLDQVLVHTLAVDDAISFEDLYPKDKFPPYTPPQVDHAITPSPPSRSSYIGDLESPGVFERLLGLGRGSRLRRLQAAEQHFQEAQTAHQDACRKAAEVQVINDQKLKQARAKYEEQKAAFEATLAARRAEVDDFRSAYLKKVSEAVEAYCSMVLERSEYSEQFPQEFRLVYLSESQELVVEYELPSIDIVPTAKEYRYIQSKDEIQAIAMKDRDRNDVYKKVVASVTLRTVHELFEADQADCLRSVVFNGVVAAVDKATGLSVRPCLITLQSTKDEFRALDLSKVDVLACVRGLKANVSPAPGELAAVKPIVEYNMVDRRFVQESDVLSTLDERTNLLDMNPFDFEALICNLFSKMGLEARLTRKSRDGGVDVIAYDPRPVFGGKYVIQAKRYKNVVDVSAVRDLWGSMDNERAAKGILVTTSTFGPEARKFSKDKPIELMDGSQLLYHLEQIGVKAKIVIPGS